MDKQMLIKTMEKHVGGSMFINKTQLAKYLKRSRDSMYELLDGLDYIPKKREKQYFVPDVAERLMKHRRA